MQSVKRDLDTCWKHGFSVHQTVYCTGLPFDAVEAYFDGRDMAQQEADFSELAEEFERYRAEELDSMAEYYANRCF